MKDNKKMIQIKNKSIKNMQIQRVSKDFLKKISVFQLKHH